MGITLKRFNNYIFILTLLCSVHFFGLYFRLGLGGLSVKFIDAFYLLITFFMVSKLFIKRHNVNIPTRYWLFSKPIFFLFFCLFISAFSGFYFHDQSPFLTLLAMRYFCYFLIFYTLILLKIEKETVLRVIFIFAILYMIIFTLQLILFPTAIVPLGHADSFERGFLRLRLEGVGFVTLVAFYSLNNFLINKKNKLQLAFYLLCFVFIFILGFRTLLLTFVVSSLLLCFIYIKTTIMRLFLVVFAFVFMVIILQTELFSEFVFAMIDKTNAQIDEGDDYIRFLTFNFLFNTVNVNFASLFFGNGFPVEGTNYGELVIGKGSRENGYIAADLGLIGFVFNYGLLSLIAFLNIFRIAIFKKLPKHSVYLNIFFFYLVISSITTAEIFRAGMFGVEMLGLYLITCVNHEKHTQ